MMMIVSCFSEVVANDDDTNDLLVVAIVYFQFYFHHEKKECGELQMMMHVKKIVDGGDDDVGLVDAMIFCYRRSVHDVLVESSMELHFPPLLVVDRDFGLQMCQAVLSRRGKRICSHYSFSFSL